MRLTGTDALGIGYTCTGEVDFYQCVGSECTTQSGGEFYSSTLISAPVASIDVDLAPEDYYLQPGDGFTCTWFSLPPSLLPFMDDFTGFEYLGTDPEWFTVTFGGDESVTLMVRAGFNTNDCPGLIAAVGAITPPVAPAVIDALEEQCLQNVGDAGFLGGSATLTASVQFGETCGDDGAPVCTEDQLCRMIPEIGLGETCLNTCVRAEDCEEDDSCDIDCGDGEVCTAIGLQGDTIDEADYLCIPAPVVSVE
jgi:hypothetical protein